MVGPIKYIMGKLLHVHAGYANITVQFKLSAAGRGGGTSKTSPKDGKPLGTDIKSYFTKISTKEGEVAWSYIRYKLVFEVKLYIQWISLNLTEA